MTQHGEDALTKIFGSDSPAVNEGLFLQAYKTLKPCEVEDGSEDMRGYLHRVFDDSEVKQVFCSGAADEVPTATRVGRGDTLWAFSFEFSGCSAHTGQQGNGSEGACTSKFHEHEVVLPFFDVR